MDMIVSSVDDNAVLWGWLKPVAPICAPAPVRSPDSWTVVTTATGFVNPWTGDVRLVMDGGYTCDLVAVIRLTAQTPSFIETRV